jgi:DNA mismatch endonuclease, patch repair protein
MTDTVDVATRSRIMSAVRGKDTKPEVLMRSLLHRRGFRFKLNVKGLPGTPDIVFPHFRAVIFVNGCFWHGHDCPAFKMPKSRVDYWRRKIESNRANDHLAAMALFAEGWRVCIVWECALRGKGGNAESAAENAAAWLRGGKQTFLEIRGEKNAP